MSDYGLPSSFAERMQEAEKRLDENDYVEALRIFKELESEGCHLARVEIGNIYFDGRGGVSRNIQEALRWYQKAVDMTDDPYAHLGLGGIYANGVDVDLDYQKALFHLIRADAIPQAQIALGLLYHRGAGVKQDPARARQYYEKAAAAGYPLALRYLGNLELEQSNYIKGAILNLKGIVVAAMLATKNPKDHRLQDLVPERYRQLGDQTESDQRNAVDKWGR